jgi:hypothetical protein
VITNGDVKARACYLTMVTVKASREEGNGLTMACVGLEHDWDY